MPFSWLVSVINRLRRRARTDQLPGPRVIPGASELAPFDPPAPRPFSAPAAKGIHRTTVADQRRKQEQVH